MARAKPAKTQKSGKRGGKTVTSWKPGQSGNPRGRPPEGESWAAVIKKISNMTGDEAARYFSIAAELSKPLAKLQGVVLKDAIVARCFVALMFEPQAAMLNALMDRAEGKLSQSVPTDLKASLLLRMQELGLTLDDIRGDGLTTELFRQAGIVVGGDDGAPEPDSPG